jgi:transcriptional regulator with XRE-family HTH domain
MESRKFSEKVRHRLEQIGMSQSELARRINITRSWLNDILRRNKPPIEHVIPVAKNLRVTADYLLDDSIATGELPQDRTETEEKILYLASLVGWSEAEKRLVHAPEGEDGGKRYNKEWGGTPIEEEAKSSPKKPRQPKKPKPGSV